jgi:hypothetical protein
VGVKKKEKKKNKKKSLSCVEMLIEGCFDNFVK